MLNDFISLFFPNYCVSCYESLVKGEKLICLSCQHIIPKTNSHLQQPNYIETKFYGKVRLSFALAYYQFLRKGRVQKILHALKYENKPELGELLGNWYGSELSHVLEENTFDVIVPVPLHKTKLRNRGYNQSEKFAKGLSDTFHVKCCEDALKRIRKTTTQTNKSRIERWKNVENIFEVNKPYEIIEKRVMLVDDVITTGATLESCVNELYKAGAKEVGIVAIAAAI